MVSSMDDGIGMVLDALDELGLRENTMVAFVSDNGGPLRSNGSTNDPLRGKKGEVFEGGIRVPFLVSWPSRVPAGRVLDQPVIALDLPVTALQLAGADRNGPLDGADIMPLLAGDSDAQPHEALFWRMNRGRDSDFAVRSGDLKLVRAVGGRSAAGCLFDLAEDIGEQHELGPGETDKAAKLLALWNEWNKGNKAPEFPGYSPYHSARNRFFQELRDTPVESIR